MTEKENLHNEEEVEIELETNEQTEATSATNGEAANTQPESNDEVVQFKERIQELEQQVEEKENRILRLQADFDNYRRRIRNEMDVNERYQSQRLATELLSALDNFERALNTEVTTDEGKSILTGLDMVYKGILTAFEGEGITQIESVGKEFDPNLHHAVMQGQDDNYDPNTVIEEFQKGYMLKDRVIRPAMVKVNQ